MRLLCRTLLGFAVFLAWALPTSAVSQIAGPAPPTVATAWLRAWPTSGHDPQRTNQSPTTGPTEPHLLFEQSGVAISLVAPDGTLYGNLHKGGAVALGPGGKQLWSHRRCAGLPCRFVWLVGVSPQGGLLGIVQDPQGSAALDYSAGGGLRWVIKPLGPVKGGTPLVTDSGQFYFELAHSENEEVCAGVTELQADDGRPIRCVHVDLQSMAPDGHFYAVDWSSLHAYSPDGTSLWLTPVEGTGRDPSHPASRPDNIYPSFPTVGRDGTIYVGIGRQLAAVNPEGHILWQIAKKDQAMALALRSDSVILAAGRKRLIAVRQDGKELWNVPIGPAGLERPTLVVDAAGTAYVGTADGKVRIFSSDGRLLRTLAVGPRSSWAPGILVAGGRLIVSGTDRVLRVYGT